jgi:hypothetical protein
MLPQDPLSGKRITKDGRLDITIQDVELINPSRRAGTILKRLNLAIPALKTTAIVDELVSLMSSISRLIEI